VQVATDVFAGSMPVMQVYIALFLVIATFSAITFGIVVSYNTEHERKGFLLLTSKSETEFQSYERYEGRGWLLNLVWTVLSGVLIGVAGNYCFAWLTSNTQ
jgi:hypothetical protein